MRLIDADKINFEEAFGGQSDFAKEIRESAKSLIDRQPTAFDKEKVIDELQKPDPIIRTFIGKSFTTIDRAIEIVEKGGIE